MRWRRLGRYLDCGACCDLVEFDGCSDQLNDNHDDEYHYDNHYHHDCGARGGR